MKFGWSWHKRNTSVPHAPFGCFEHFKNMDSAEALVREVVQNSWDARRGKEQVKVTFTLSNVDANIREKYLPSKGKGSQFRHLEACLADDEEGPMRKYMVNWDRLSDGEGNWLGDSMPVLIIEDFGTMGLDGATSTDPPVKGRFTAYQREWARNDNDDGGGAHGYGKASLSYASDAYAVFSLSTRHNEDGDLSTVLMGTTILAAHELPAPLDPSGKHTHYEWTCMYAEYDPEVENGEWHEILLENSGHNDHVREFAENFNLTRTMDSEEQRGLSIVIPYPRQSITLKRLVEEAARNYFTLILTGNLVVEIHEDSKQVVLDKDSLRDLLEAVRT